MDGPAPARRISPWGALVAVSAVLVVGAAAALLTALVVTQALADGHRLHVGADTVGVAAGGFVAWRWGSVIACVLVAVGVTAALRAL